MCHSEQRGAASAPAEGMGGAARELRGACPAAGMGREARRSPGFIFSCASADKIPDAGGFFKMTFSIVDLNFKF